MSRLRVYARIARVLLVVTLGLTMASVFGVFERLAWRTRCNVGSAGRVSSWHV